MCHEAREEAGVPEHALVVHGALERTVHFDDDAVGGLEALVVVAVRVLVAAVLHALSQARVAILVRPAEVAEGPVEQRPDVRERAALGLERGREHGDEGHDPLVVELEEELAGDLVQVQAYCLADL